MLKISSNTDSKVKYDLGKKKRKNSIGLKIYFDPKSNLMNNLKTTKTIGIIFNAYHHYFHPFQQVNSERMTMTKLCTPNNNNNNFFNRNYHNYLLQM